MTSTNGSEETNPTTGVNVTNMNIAKNLLEKVAWLLESKVHHFYASDRTTEHEKFVIEFNHKRKD